MGREAEPVVSIVFALLSAFSNACTAVLQRLASVSRPAKADSGWRIALYLVREPKWLVGLAFMAGTFVFQAVALYFGQLAVVQPILVTELIFTLALRRWWLKDGITRRTWAAAGMICIGLAGFLVAAHPEEGHRSPTVPDWIWALVSRGVVVGILAAAQPDRLADPSGGPAGYSRGHGLGHRRRLRQGDHRPPGPRTAGRPVLALAGYAMVVTGVVGRCWWRRPSPPGR